MVCILKSLAVTSALPASSPTLLTSLLTNLAYQPSTTLLTSLHQPLPLANSRWNARLRIMYIYGTYIPPLERASLSLILSSSHQAQNIITKPLIAPSYDLSHILPIFSTCTTLTIHCPTTLSIILQSLLLPSSLTCYYTSTLLLLQAHILTGQGGPSCTPWPEENKAWLHSEMATIWQSAVNQYRARFGDRDGYVERSPDKWEAWEVSSS